ncbi:MAG TPA: stalk domain-containing protein [Symbiobacteriaceae bacterium]|nr:stalk domain-containing protein [Symbiobacteriaceae bacterium]
MATSCPRWVSAAAALLLMLCAGTAFGADPSAQPPMPQRNYKDAQYVQLSLGQPNLEDGLRLVDGLPDGLTQPSLELGGRQSLANQIAPERYFYFDVDDTYISGGKNKVQIAVTYRDMGLTPIYLEYDSYDPLRPQSKADDVTRKRVVLTSRGNTEGLKTQFATLEDARFSGTQAGGADFRVFTTDALILTNVSVLRMAHEEPAPSIRVQLDGKLVTFDPNEVQPFIQNNRTLVPMRAIFNALGVRNDDIIWHNDTRTVEAKKGNTMIALTIDDVTVKVNGKVLDEKLDQPAIIVGSRTVVPLRFVATQFGLKVEWNEAERMVILTTLPPAPADPTWPTFPLPPAQPGSTQPGSTQPGTPQPGTPQPGTTQPSPPKP